MATDKTQGLQTREARDLAATMEATRPGVLLTPPVDIFEDPDSITVLADMPGVAPGRLKIDLHEGVLTITGHAGPQEGSRSRFCRSTRRGRSSGASRSRRRSTKSRSARR
jgi:HSP20 family molecular chaperone IbpA